MAYAHLVRLSPKHALVFCMATLCELTVQIVQSSSPQYQHPVVSRFTVTGKRERTVTNESQVVLIRTVHVLPIAMCHA